jgi:hypothetical protein
MNGLLGGGAGVPSKRAVRRAGEFYTNGLCAGASADEVLANDAIINAWRRVHVGTLSEMLDVAEGVAAGAGVHAVCAGRIKKKATIIGKLMRPGTSHKLNSMYDVAGCRIVADSPAEQAQLYDALLAHPFCDAEKTAKRDYVLHPKADGYRAKHMVFAFAQQGLPYERLFCELQIRTRMQHLWACALEVYDLAAGRHLKFGESAPAAQEFFRRAAAIIEQIEAERAVCTADIRRDFAGAAGAGTSGGTSGGTPGMLGVLEILRAANFATYVVNDAAKNTSDQVNCAGYYLIDLQPDVQTLICTKLPETDAFSEYIGREDLDSNADHDYVLVRAENEQDIGRLFLNYFADISDFLTLCNKHIDAFY